MTKPVEAERAVIGAVMMRNDVAHKVLLQPKDFSDGKSARAWAAILETIADGGAADPITVEAKTDGRVSAEWLMDADSRVATAENVEHYAAIVADAALGRRVMKLAHEIINSKKLSGAELLAMAQDGIEALARAQEGKGYYSAEEIAQALVYDLDAGSDGRGLLTGVDDWDDQAEQDRGDVLIVGADTSVGKSQFLAWLRQRYVDRGERVLLFSTESKYKKVGRRDLSLLSGINSRDIKRGELTRDGLRDYMDGIVKMAEQRYWVCDSLYDADDMCRLIRFMVARFGISTVQVDHINECTSANVIDPNNRVIYCAERFAQEASHGNGLYMQIASQVIKEVGKEKRAAHMSDLYYGNRLQHIAQVVAMLHRPGRYTQKADLAEFNVRLEKVRDGETGILRWGWNHAMGQVTGPRGWTAGNSERSEM